MTFLQSIRPLVPFLPAVESPKGKVPLEYRMQSTLFAALLVCVMSNLPLFGIVRESSPNDPFYHMRVILASNRGTLMELGVSPIVSAGMVLQLLVGSRMMYFNQNVAEDRVLFQASEKICGILFTFVCAAAYVVSGMYGPLSAIGNGNAALIVLQLTGAGVVLLMLDEFVQKYGFGSGLNLFIAVHICENIVWSALSTTTVTTAAGTEMEGALFALFHLLFTRKNKIAALKLALYRQNLPNISNLLSTVLIFVSCCYIQGWKINIPVKMMRARGQAGSYPIKFLYTGNMPIVLYSAFISNVYFMSKMLTNSSPHSAFFKLLGNWQPNESGQVVPVGGLCYYLSPPTSMFSFIKDPLHTIFYLIVTLIACGFLSKSWLNVSHTTARDLARKLSQQQISIRGMREQAVTRYLNNYVPLCAVLGGATLGLLSVTADFIGALGTGSGILLAVTIAWSIFEEFQKARLPPSMAAQYAMFM
mmetsp:Transcript_30943/g.90478  ORF Transcript_30943/g.90478 Transcript_30943/m.90478 type:complete len:475 (-) Transcript_30943:153-1577(-)|eukprot:CAMPEP_0181038104 /NCGR_PEP_ID=MMETSP1070-20121207/9757_1 /TAXON_ID=265543 /ORGANISM="Minutocellus polymorphus, Strain NH13" /LENGTH=474 /DNA_ID=CAMNT_0023115865 /DNA_START=104 /DNA_END=1528 /DNA_ORIENTATION=-